MHDIARIAARCGFTVTSAEELPEIEGTAYVMRHNASGARLLYLRNDDANKAFSISFKTPAADDTGVFHILEHSVLCGSRKFPVKEPFVNLLKSSMQTFLNAMTFPDKTMYPVASTNEQDLLNLMDVYLDAVFYPAIYDKRTIFEQEGWHLEVEGEGGEETRGEAAAEGAVADAASGEGGAGGACEAGGNGGGVPDAAPAAPRLAYNGVVFNEMKGALSDPESMLYDALSAALFPDTTYRFESGGTPAAIPTLTYEAFLDTHARHYRPDNSYITLYGDLDPETFLGFIDREYLAPLSQVERGPLDANPLEAQAPVVARGVQVRMDTAPENACAALGYVAGSMADRERMVAVDVLLDAIAGSNEAPLKRALLDADIAADATAYLADAVLQPFAVVQLRGAKPGAMSTFRAVVETEARRLADGGLDRELVEAALSHAEFVMRERNFGYADGVRLAMSSMGGWLYDDEAATAYLRYEQVFSDLRAKISEGYFERLLRELVCESAHCAEVELVPGASDEDAVERARLDALAQTFAPDDFDAVRAEVARLRAAQNAPDAPEDVAKLPQLAISDIGEAPAEGAYGLQEGTPLACLRHDIPTHGIAYSYLYFDLGRCTFDELPYATVLAMMLGRLDTARHTAAEIDTLAQSKLGNLSFFTEVHEDARDADVFAAKFVASSSALSKNVEHMALIANEVLHETDFTDHEKMRDILMQKRVAMEQGFASAGHSVAMARVASYYLPAAVVREQMGGIGFYGFLRDLLENFDERVDDVERRLRELTGRLFVDDTCLLSFAGSDEDMERYWAVGRDLGRFEIDSAAAAAHAGRLKVPAPRDAHEALVVPTDVTFTAVGADRRALGVPYAGAWLVATHALSYDYLWNEVRVKGGAYGAGFQATRAGSTRLYSYRDPRVDETLARFAGAGAWLSAFDPDEAEMAGYVVSTVASIDSPLKARELLRRQDGMYLAHYAPEERRRVREQVLACTPVDVRALGQAVERVVDEGHACVVGNRAIIERSTAGWNVVDVMG
ncbi:MAG: insulinase family protein [Eggerthellaceae bacterium]|nr:insulinase family protein [Eggerthellaceae bacterium]